MPPRESKDFVIAFFNNETGEFQEVRTITEPIIDLPDDADGDFLCFSKPITDTFEFHARPSRKFLYDVYAMLYQGFSNSAKMHGGRTFR